MRIAGDDTTTIVPATRAAGRITVPGDKSISHRYALLAALCYGTSTIRGYSDGFDCRTTLACLRALGTGVEWQPGLVTIEGGGRLREPAAPLDAENSGTTMRLLSGIVAAHPFRTVITGDETLLRRPMRRVIAPLMAMGARVEAADGRPPLVIDGTRLQGITHRPDVASAQVKGCVLLAGLLGEGTTTVVEPAPTRDHTELALETFGVTISRGPNAVTVVGGQRPEPRELQVPGDISSAAFWGALAAATPDGDVTIERVGLNPTRTGVLEILRRAGADVTVTLDEAVGLEPCGTVRIRCAEWRSFEVAPAEVPGVIDEIPALAALAAMMPDGRTFTVRGARELRVKESDRITALAAGFRAMGSDVQEYEDGFTLTARPLGREPRTVVTSAYDHRLAMAFAIAATRASEPVHIHCGSAAGVSYPSFFQTLGALMTGEVAP